MKNLKLVLTVIAGIFILTLIVEGIEFLIVLSLSEQGATYLMENQKEYFAIRNTQLILGLKAIYSFFAAFVVGSMVSKINKNSALTAIIIIIIIQLLSLTWAGFYSEFKTTGPYWMWLYLMIVIPSGLYTGYRISNKKEIIEPK